MENKDIIGQSFTCFKFENSRHLTYSSEHTSYIGIDAIVKNLHSTWPEYARVELTDKNGKTQRIHYPVEGIKKQIEEREEKSIEEIINEMKHLTLRI